MSDIILKDGTVTQDPRLDRIVEFDERSREYPIRTLVAGLAPRSNGYPLTKWFNQGYEGACVGFSFAHEIAAEPQAAAWADENFARRLYWKAQQLDQWPGGAYAGADPFYEGTSVISAAKHLKNSTLYKEYRWAFNLNDVVLALGYEGPGVLGCNWYEGMMNPDTNGFIKPTGAVVGGHAILIRGVDVDRKIVRLTNSWGKNWGKSGDCFMTFADLETVLKDSGEFCIPIGRNI